MSRKPKPIRSKTKEDGYGQILTQSDAIGAFRLAVRNSDVKAQYAILSTREMWTYDQAWSDSEIAHQQLIGAYKDHFYNLGNISDESKKVLADIFDQMQADWEKIVTENTKTQLFGATRPKQENGEGEIIVKSEGEG